MKKFATFAISALLLGTAAIGIVEVAPAEARATINQRQNRQHHRIYRGSRNGSLTRQEGRRLRRQQVRIDRQERRFRRSGGHVSLRERRILRNRQNQASRNIYRLRHNRFYR